ncbi:CBN-RSD-6 protein [Caenorhabditis brenneri]|uniref:CBN-RSD-6 protein n=1 Tax=Caenorhabditis brenneri TaxID=135651 RepID=G0NLL1_CAEBE|nr:CBN-RSD-6 protein [Caenorhabditis brenneri]
MTSHRFPSAVLLEELLAYVEKVVLIPGETAEEKENYIANLKNQMPEILDELHVDLENAHIKWGRSVVDENGHRSISTFAEDAKEDELHFRILEHLKTLPRLKFSCSEIISQLMDVTGEQDQDYIRRKLTFILFEKLKGTYSYVPGSKDIIEKHDKASSSDYYDAPLVHKMLQDSSKKTLNVTLRKFLSFKKFSVCPVDCLAELEEMEKEIEALVEDSRTKLDVAPAGGWKLNHGCLVKVNGPVPKWARGFLYRSETNSSDAFRVYLLDYGCVQLNSLRDLLVLPQKYLTLPPYAIPCSLFGDEVVIAALENELCGTFGSYSEEFVIETTGETLNDDFKTFIVSLYISGANGSRKNILDDI